MMLRPMQTHSPRKAKNTRLGLALFGLLSLTACDQIEYVFDTNILVQHFENYQEGFEALGAALLADPEVRTITYCEDGTECFIGIRPLTDDELAQRARYRPLMAGLDLRGGFFIERRQGNNFVIPNTLWANWGPYPIQGEFWLREEHHKSIPHCRDYNPTTYRFSCQLLLDEHWSLQWVGYHEKISMKCHDYEGEFNENDPSYFACIDECIEREEAKLSSPQ